MQALCGHKCKRYSMKLVNINSWKQQPSKPSRNSQSVVRFLNGQKFVFHWWHAFQINTLNVLNWHTQ